MTFLPRTGGRFAIATHALLVCALWAGTTAAQPQSIASIGESGARVSHPIQRVAATAPSRPFGSSLRAGQDDQRPAPALDAENIAAEGAGPDFTYGNGYFGTEEFYDVGSGEGVETCDECGQFDPSHKPGCGNDCDWRWTDNLSVFGGAHSFKGPVDEGLNGNFGLGTGLNWGGPLWQAMGIGYQVGWQAVFSNFEGERVLGALWSDDRTQHFITAGIFHRPVNAPIQWGVVFDWLRDEYYIEQSLSQIRAEVSVLGPYQNEIGFRGATSTDDDTTNLDVQFPIGVNQFLTIQETHTWEPTDQYSFFFRRRFASGIEGRIWGGFTGRSDGLFGADTRVPVSRDLAIQAGFNYLAPHEQSAVGGQREESWGLVMNLVWYPGRTAEKATQSPWRPLMKVANNSVFMVDRRVVTRPGATPRNQQVVINLVGEEKAGKGAPLKADDGGVTGTFTVQTASLTAFVDQSPVNYVDNDGDGIFGRFWDGNNDGIISGADTLNPSNYDLDDLVRITPFSFGPLSIPFFLGPRSSGRNLILTLPVHPEYDNPEDMFWDDNPEDGLYHESWRGFFGF